MRRRRALALVAAGVVSTGCLNPFGFGSRATLSLEPVDPAEHYAFSVDEIDNGWESYYPHD
ncbi:MAG: hypothetical protein U5J64_06540 [Halobacteriales archaeon]|nr:hypothetical protein [Halobacteriales archaeon]